MKFELISILPIITTLIGVLVGALIGELRDQRKTNLEYKKDINVSLFYLVQLRALLLKLDLEHFVKYSHKLFDSKFKIKKLEEDKISDFLIKIYNMYLTNVLNETLFKSFKEVEQQYIKTLKTIAKHEPHTANKLFDRRALSEYLIFTDGFIEQINNTNTVRIKSKSRTIEDSTSLLLKNINNELFQSALSEIDENIKVLSSKINRKTRTIITEQLGYQHKLSEKDFERYFENKGIIKIIAAGDKTGDDSI